MKGSREAYEGKWKCGSADGGWVAQTGGIHKEKVVDLVVNLVVVLTNLVNMCR